MTVKKIQNMEYVNTYYPESRIQILTRYDNSQNTTTHIYIYYIQRSTIEVDSFPTDLCLAKQIRPPY